jgi:SAM-dependent methyltransferase
VTERTPLAATQAYFGPRAAGWETRFPDDLPAYESAVAALDLRRGERVVDVGCGTGRALVPMRAVVGAGGVVIGVDATPEMLREAVRCRRDRVALLVMADVMSLPLPDGGMDAVLAAGLMPHLVDPIGGLAELARMTRAGGRLVIFHPIGRAALAARHGGVPSDDDAVAPARLRGLLEATGWLLDAIEDSQERYLARAVRGR